MDGNYTAIVTGNTVNIYSSTGDLQSNFTSPTQQLSVSFSPTHLFMTDSSNVYVVNTSPCPATYVNQNLYCNCPDGLFSIDGSCQSCSFPCKSCSGSVTSCDEY